MLLYAKSVESFPHPPVVDPSTQPDSKLFRPEIRNTIVKNGTKNPVSKITLPKGFPADFDSGCIRSRATPWPSYLSDMIVENGKLTSPVTAESGWSSKDLALEFIKNNCVPIEDSKGQETSFVISKSGAIEVVKRRSDYQSHVISVLNGFGGTQKAAAQLNEIGAFFNGYPKPVDLIRYFVQMACGRDGIFLDFFAGSGPSGHAIIEQNARDIGTRRFILVQLPETLDPSNQNQKAATEYCPQIGRRPTVAELTKERLRRAAAKVKADNPMFAGDTGFRVFKLDISNIHAWNPDPDNLEKTLLDHEEHILTGRTEMDIMYELLLKLGLDLCVPIESRSIAGKTVCSIGGGVLLTCLSVRIAVAEVEALALGIVSWHKKLAPAGDTTCVFRDSAFENDIAKSNLAAILEQYGIANVRSL